jgi:hypothetical protein
VVEQLMFLGEYLDCRIRVGEALLVTRQHPMLAFRRGERVYVELPVERCAVLSDAHGVSASTYLGEEREPEPEHRERALAH